MTQARTAPCIGPAPALLLALAGLFASGCSTAPPAPPEAPGRVMRIGGEGYVVKQLTAGTWTATPQGAAAAANAANSQAALQGAIEEASGCKVTDSAYSSTGKQFDAQVLCPGQTN